MVDLRFDGEAAASPNAMLRSLCVRLLDQIESHTFAVMPARGQPLPELIAERHTLHSDLVDAIEQRNRELALALIPRHNTSYPSPAGAVEAVPTQPAAAL